MFPAVMNVNKKGRQTTINRRTDGFAREADLKAESGRT
jgi:hypothetical protein